MLRSKKERVIRIKSEKEIEAMRAGGKILARVLREVSAAALPGVLLTELDDLAGKLIDEAGAEPSFRGYRPSGESEPYPGNICLSVNDEVVHGIPRSIALKESDLLNIDVGVHYRGFHTDSAVTVGIGKVSPTAHKLIKVTREALKRAILLVKPGTTLGDVGHSIEEHVTQNNFSVVENLVGHGIGEKLQEEPVVPNFGVRGEGIELEEGMVIAIEPMVSAGKGHIVLAEDGFTYKTADGSLAAHFEHTVAVTRNGNLILTKE
jgi:methionyl aminopeptidase